MAADYVGELYAVLPEGEDEPIEVERTALGVDRDGLGVVQAFTRADLERGVYIEPPDVEPVPCDRLWYRRRRPDYPGGNRWYHDLDNAVMFSNHDQAGPPLVVIVGEDVETCPGIPGEFLCG